MAAVIFPMLKQIEGNVVGLMEETLKRRQDSEVEEEKKMGSEEDECGICMEMQCKVVLPICGHSMCVACFNEWYIRSRSCPFCRGSLKRVTCDDVWVLTSRCEVVDAMTLAKDNLGCFYLYLENLPLLASDDSLLMYNYLM